MCLLILVDTCETAKLVRNRVYQNKAGFKAAVGNMFWCLWGENLNKVSACCKGTYKMSLSDFTECVQEQSHKLRAPCVQETFLPYIFPTLPY